MGDLKMQTAQQRASVLRANDKASRSLGISVEIPAPGAAVASMTVRDDMLNGFDVCHGGLLFALADTAFAFACNATEQRSFAASASIEFLRPALLGDCLRAHAAAEHRGRRTGYYTVKIENQDARLVALFRGRSVSPGVSRESE